MVLVLVGEWWGGVAAESELRETFSILNLSTRKVGCILISVPHFCNFIDYANIPANYRDGLQSFIHAVTKTVTSSSNWPAGRDTRGMKST
jgi:hypothetical protein